jgi:predicted AAA+ superfamily ATPase
MHISSTFKDNNPIMSYYRRYLNIQLPAGQSAFLWGARKTGKSTFLKHEFVDSIYIDLLKSDLFFKYAKHPNVFREELLAIPSQQNKIVIIDEVQKIPTILDEVHWLIENTEYQFILCGSSARTLKRQSVNMLGGRAWKYNFFPLIYPELPEYDLLKIFNTGTIPSHYDSSNIKKSMKAYLEDYIRQEIQSEGLVRNLPGFTRFLDALRFSHGEMINFTNIAREAGVDAKTVKEYFNILVDTLLGYFIYPYNKKVSREIISETPKFYLFDVGLANFIQKFEFQDDLLGAQAGKALEHLVILEIIAYKYLNDQDFEIRYWRTKSGVEVDIILGEGEVAIEVKNSLVVHKTELKSLKVFASEYKPKKLFMITMEGSARKVECDAFDINILSIKEFLALLWDKKVI